MLSPFTRIVLDEIKEDPDPISPGEQATVVGYDAADSLMVSWDCGRSLNLIPGVDRYHVLNPKNEDELDRSWSYLKEIQKRAGETGSRCPRCGKEFDCKRGAISRRVKGVSICSLCGSQEAIEDFIRYASSTGNDAEVTVPVGKNLTGYESEVDGDKERLKVKEIPVEDWYIVKVWAGKQ